MDTNAAKEIAYSRFIAAWGALDPAVPFVLDNEEFRHPVAGTWARFVVRETGSEQETLGAIGHRKYKRSLVGTLELYCAIDRGTQKADQLVKAFRDAFEGVTDQDVYFLETQISEIGIEGNAHRVNALSLFWFYETK